MNVNNGYYVSQHPNMGQPQPMGIDGTMQPSPVDDMSSSAMNMTNLDGDMMIGGPALDGMFTNNSSLPQRRRQSIHGQYPIDRMDTDVGIRRASMGAFGGTMASDPDEFQFDPIVPQQDNVRNMSGVMGNAQNTGIHSRKGMSRRSLTLLDTRFSGMGNGYDQVASAPVCNPSMDPNNPLAYDVSSYIPTTMGLPMDFMDIARTQGPNGDMTLINNYAPSFQKPPVPSTFVDNMDMPQNTMGMAGNEDNMMAKMPQLEISDPMQTLQGPNLQSNVPLPQAEVTTTLSCLDPLTQPAPVRQIGPSESMGPVFGGMADVSGGMLAMNSFGPVPSQFPNAYSSSGFDMIRVLMQVGSRPNPEINIGAVDLSCAFVVCDLEQHDLPIVYCSDVFERLTGYSKHDILSRNCRFLQAPDGRVQAGVKRKYVDDKSVHLLKNSISQKREVQVSLINYRKGGQPFMNLLTMIPVKWDTDKHRYYVGFQMDLVEQPNSVTSRNPDGTYAINYQRGMLPRYIIQAPDSDAFQHDIGQTIGRDEVSTVLTTINQGESEFSKQIWDKILLENTDDVVHVLSLKGVFLYLSSACRNVLEYEPTDLVGTALSTVCHPSDIVPVTRELKDTSTGNAVNVVFRIRRKYSGYTWFESHGSVLSELSKGKKYIILVGRERPVYALQKRDLLSAGGIGESEVWSKMSTSGMFLYVSANSRTLLDRQPGELIGTSVQSLMRPDTKVEFGRMLEFARTGRQMTFKHDLQNRRGQVLQAQTTLYPGDAVEGFKPTFFVAQTRLLKLSRSLAAHRQSVTSSLRTDHAPAGPTTPNTQLSGVSNPHPVSTQSSHSVHFDVRTYTTAGSGGLQIGNQDEALASEDNVFDELKTTRSTSWQFELRQMEKQNRLLQEELSGLLSRKKKRKRKKGSGQLEKDCANCHTRVTPEWRRGPSGNRDLCNSCGLRWAKQNGRLSPRKPSDHNEKPPSASPADSDHAGNATPDQQAKTTSASNLNGLSQSPQGPPTVEKRSNSLLDPGKSRTYTGIPSAIEEVAEPTSQE